MLVALAMPTGYRFEDNTAPSDSWVRCLFRVRESNIIAAKAVADAVRTSLGPRGMDKMVRDTE